MSCFLSEILDAVQKVSTQLQLDFNSMTKKANRFPAGRCQEVLRSFPIVVFSPCILRELRRAAVSWFVWHLREDRANPSVESVEHHVAIEYYNPFCVPRGWQPISNQRGFDSCRSMWNTYTNRTLGIKIFVPGRHPTSGSSFSHRWEKGQKISIENYGASPHFPYRKIEVSQGFPIYRIVDRRTELDGKWTFRWSSKYALPMPKKSKMKTKRKESSSPKQTKYPLRKTEDNLAQWAEKMLKEWSEGSLEPWKFEELKSTSKEDHINLQGDRLERVFRENTNFVAASVEITALFPDDDSFHHYPSYLSQILCQPSRNTIWETNNSVVRYY